MFRLDKIRLIAGGLALAWSMAAGAQTNDGAVVAERAASVGLDATAAIGNARIIALVAGGGFIVRAKGVASITVPSVGQTCIKPTSTTLNVNTIVPVTTVDWSNSVGVDNVVQYRSSGSGCPAGQIAVLTFSRASPASNYALASNVAFTIVIP